MFFMGGFRRQHRAGQDGHRGAGLGVDMRRVLIFLGVVLAVSALYLYAFPAASLLYETVVVFHLFGGACFLVLALLGWLPLLRGRSVAEKLGWALLFAGGAFGAVLLFTGASRREWPVLYTHELVTALACAVLLWGWSGRRGWLQGSALQGMLRLAVCLALTAALASGAWWVRTVPWQRSNTAHNPKIAPANADAEGDGPNGPFFPSMVQTTNGKTVPEDFFLSSASCKQCHADIYRQWESSAHHYSSFNNQWYLQSIVYMQEVDGVQASKLCAGCHDAALFYAGNFNTPIKDRVSTPAAQAGIGCVVCHSIRRVKSTMGDTDFVFAYPPLQKLVASNNPILHHMVDYLIKVAPEPHRRTFMRPFMQATPAQYCSACHKVHLDVPVNNYRWVRGFNEYDNWQASGVSGMGARSFYYPPRPMDCVDCHMTLTPSHDEGNVDGLVHSHRFLAANTALPFVNQDEVQLARTEAFLKNNKVRVDIFAISPETATQKPQTMSAASSGPQLETTFAIGEESGMGPIAASETGLATAPITAPLDRVQASVSPGETVRVDVVVRTLGVGHFFPGGTVDAFDCWLELKATDDRGRVLFWSGMVEDHGHGPVEPGAHFYRSMSIDAHGGPINKRNAWAARATVYVHLVPPGAADTAHFRLHIPRDARGKVHLEAKLNYRKFSWVNTQFSFAGVFEDTGPHDVGKSYDDRRMVFTGDTSHVAGKIKAVPDLPIVVLARSEAELTVLPVGAPVLPAQVVLEKTDWQRWNDYGIGLFLQGDMKGAGAAFTKVTEIDATNPDGWVNIGRVRVQEGNLTGARQVLERALQIAPSLARANYFYARVLRQMGDYDGAIARLRLVLAQYPQDRVARNDLGRIFFLKHQYANAVREFEKTLAIDPEDLEANYNLMLCYTGLGNATRAAAYETRFLRFKADESAQAITGPYLARHPEDNLERQPVHEHGSVPLSVANSADAQMENAVSSPSPSAPSPSGRGDH
jgi:Flp pilus assembly protein TadD